MTRQRIARMLVFLAAVLAAGAACAQNPTSQGTINAVLINHDGIALIFDSASNGVSLSGSGTGTATLNFGTISAYGSLASGVTRTGPSGGSFTVSTPFSVKVIEGGLNSRNYTLTAKLTAAAPTGLTYQVDTVTLSTTSHTLQTNGTYGTDVGHTAYLQVSTAASGAGGPAVGTPLTDTINFTATAN